MHTIPFEPIAGHTVVLEPLASGHTPDLIRAALDGQSIFDPLRTVPLHDEGEVRDWMARSLRTARAGQGLPFAIVDVATAEAVGSIWYRDIRPEHRSCTVGWSWLSPDADTSATATEARLLLVQHAFEDAQFERVEFHLDATDDQARAGIELLGARCEGVLRNEYLDRDGILRDTALYALLLEEWPAASMRAFQTVGGPVSDDERARVLRRLHETRQDRESGSTMELPLPRA